jgi:hypothetical protein
VAGQLAQITSTLRTFIEREKQTPNPSDWSGVLTSGAFESEGSVVKGSWSIEPGFLQNLVSGSTN